MNNTRAPALEFGPVPRSARKEPRQPASIADQRLAYLKLMAQAIWQAAPYLGSRNVPLTLHQFVPIPGPRAGGLNIYAGFSSGQLYSKLTTDKCALARQLITWPFESDVNVAMIGKCVRIEAAWPDGLAETKIPLAKAVNLDAYRGRWRQVGGRWMLAGDGQFILGKDEQGRVIVRHLNSNTAHYLIGGTTGSGKTVLIRLLLVQLAADPNNRIVGIDGKRGRDLKGDKFFPYSLERLNGLVGPLAFTPEQWLTALVWSSRELSRRMAEPSEHEKRLVIVIDEVQEVIKALPLAQEIIRRLVQLGRSCNVHVILATQHPIVEELGGSTVARLLLGRVALKVTDSDASRVVVGAPDPRANLLLGQGDAYSIAPASLYRVQCAYPEVADAVAVSQVPPEMECWPEADTDIGQEPENVDARRKPYSASEYAASLITAHYDEGRPSLENRVREMAKEGTGGNRSKWLYQWGKDVHHALQQVGFGLRDNHTVDEATA